MYSSPIVRTEIQTIQQFQQNIQFVLLLYISLQQVNFLRANILPGLSLDEFDSDVFIIHGESSAGWVLNELLPFLEQDRNFTCYVPARDLDGGEGRQYSTVDRGKQCSTVDRCRQGSTVDRGRQCSTVDRGR